MAKADTILNAARRSVGLRKTEEGERAAVQMTLARYGYRKIPEIQQVGDSDGKTRRVYIWRGGLGTDDIVLVTGPSYDGKVMKGKDVLLDGGGSGAAQAWSEGSEYSNSGVTGHLKRAIKRGEAKGTTGTMPKKRAPAKRKPAKRKPAPRKPTIRSGSYDAMGAYGRTTPPASQYRALAARAAKQELETRAEEIYRAAAGGASGRDIEEQADKIAEARARVDAMAMAAKAELGTEWGATQHNLNRLDLMILRPSLEAAGTKFRARPRQALDHYSRTAAPAPAPVVSDDAAMMAQFKALLQQVL